MTWTNEYHSFKHWAFGPILIIESMTSNRYKMACALIEGSDQTDTHQTVQMHSLMCVIYRRSVVSQGSGVASLKFKVRTCGIG